MKDLLLKYQKLNTVIMVSFLFLFVLSGLLTIIWLFALVMILFSIDMILLGISGLYLKRMPARYTKYGYYEGFQAVILAIFALLIGLFLLLYTIWPILS